MILFFGFFQGLSQKKYDCSKVHEKVMTDVMSVKNYDNLRQWSLLNLGI